MKNYYPYLREKKYELIAIERVAALLASTKKITPVLEPVRTATAPLVRHATAIAKAGLSIALVMNPRVGQLVGNHQATVQLLTLLRGAGASVEPALIVDAHTQASEVTALTAHAGGGATIHIHGAVPPPQVANAIMAHPAGLNVFIDRGTATSYQTGFRSTALLRDGFNAQAKNANYPPQSFFSDLHLTHSKLGFRAFGDYAPIGADYSESGGPAYAVAIHITEDQQQQGVFCNHFLSTSNATTANPAGKFGQAVAALAAYSAANPGRIDFSQACQELLQHHASGHYPGLGDLKRLATQHHLELMATLV